MFINNYKYALHVSDARRVHHQEHYKLQQQPVAAVTVYSAPDDGRKGNPKHVEHTCIC